MNDHRIGLLYANPHGKRRRNVAILRVAPELLEEILMMPDGMRIISVKDDPFGGAIEILVQHADIPKCEPSALPPDIAPTYSVVHGHDPHTFTADWGEWFTEEES